jgi:hypothetical protein
MEIHKLLFKISRNEKIGQNSKKRKKIFNVIYRAHDEKVVDILFSKDSGKEGENDFIIKAPPYINNINDKKNQNFNCKIIYINI